MKKILIATIFKGSLLTVTSVNATKLGFAVDKYRNCPQFGNINAFIGDDGITGDYLIG
jgi:hypothetical protein